MTRLNYMLPSAYRHRYEDRIRGIIAACCSVALYSVTWPLSRWIGTATDGTIPPLGCGVFLLIVASALLALSVRSIVKNGIWETCIQDGKLYLSTPSGRQVVDISSIVQFTLGQASWNDSGLIIGRLVMHDGTIVRLDARLVHYPALRRALERQNPRIHFFDKAS